MTLFLSPRFFVCCALAGWAALPAYPQAAAAQQATQTLLGRKTCPGEPPLNLEQMDCRFKAKRHLLQFVSGSVTDQAITGAIFFGAIAQLRGTPPEWKQSWGGLGTQVGSRYAQGLAKGLAVYTVSSIMRTDPRKLSYINDPGSKISVKGAGFGPRLGHVFVDWLTVRRSAEDGKGRRLPNIPLFAGAGASGFVGNAWYPDRLATNSQALQRGAGSLGTALMSSFYTEFSPEISRALGSMFKRGSKKAKP